MAKLVSFRVSNEEYQRIQDMAQQRSMSVSDLMRMLVFELKTMQQQVEAQQREIEALDEKTAILLDWKDSLTDRYPQMG